MMTDHPISIIRETPPLLSEEERRLLDKQKHEHRIQWVFLGFVGVVVLTFLVPLAVWLTRLAAGG